MGNRIRTILLIVVFFLCIALFSALSIQRNKSEVWFSTPDQDGVLLIDALRINEGKGPSYFDHPGHGTLIIYANALQFLEWANLIPASRFDQLQKSDDPLLLLPDIFLKARWVSIFLCVLCASVFGGIFFVLTRRLTFFVLGVFILLSSGGIFLQSLVIGNELPSVLFVLLAALFLAIEYKSNNPGLNHFYKISAGIFLGFAVLSKIHVIPAFLWVAIYFFLGAIKKDTPYRPKSFKLRIASSVAIGLLTCLFTASFIKTGYPASATSILVVLLLIIGALLNCFPKFEKFKGSSFISKSTLLLVGFLMSFYISFYCLNFDNKIENKSKHWKGLVFHRVFDLMTQLHYLAGK